MKKNKKILYLGLVIVLMGIWMFSLGEPSVAFAMVGFYGTPIGFILMLVGIFMKEK